MKRAAEVIMTHEKRLLTEREVEAEFGISRRTLQGWRFRRTGPPVVILSSRAVRYDRETLETWLAERTRYHDASPAA